MKVASIDCYRVGSSSKSAIILVTDPFGWNFINMRKIADKYSEGGFTVFVPDLFQGDPLNPALSMEQLRPMFAAWGAKHPIDKAVKVVQSIINEVENLHFASIQLQGFCYGAAPIFEVVASSPSSVYSAALKSVAVSHPSRLTVEHAQHVRLPVLFVCAAVDQIFTPELKQSFRRILLDERKKKEGDEIRFIDYPNTTHGFHVRPDSDAAKEQQDKAIVDSIVWFKQHAA